MFQVVGVDQGDGGTDVYWDGWEIGGWVRGQIRIVSEWKTPNKIWKCFIFYNKTGFSDQCHHSSAFSFLPFPIETSCSSVVEIAVVCACFAVCVCVCLCFLHVCTYPFLSVCPAPLPTNEKAEPQHPNRPVSHSNHPNFYCWSGRTFKKIFSQSQMMLLLLWLL